MANIVDKLRQMHKDELAELLSELSKKVDSGRHTGADVQILKEATDIYIERFESNITKPI